MLDIVTASIRFLNFTKVLGIKSDSKEQQPYGISPVTLLGNTAKLLRQ